MLRQKDIETIEINLKNQNYILFWNEIKFIL